MKTTTAQKRLEALCNEKKVNRNTCAYRLVSDSLAKKGSPIRPCWTSGSGRFTTNLDYTQDCTNLLKLLGINYSLDNDSPRGGKAGNLITLNTKLS